MKIGIVGHGFVGSAIARRLSKCDNHEICIYDKFRNPHNRIEDKLRINNCDLVFVCVPTPISADGMSCDVSVVEECLEWILPPTCIRSTVIPGTVERLTARTRKTVAFSPEYIGERPGHSWPEEVACGFLIVGGPSSLCDLVFSAYAAVPGVQLQFYKTTARVAELCKYMENCFLATKVSFVNQFYDIAGAFNVDFSELRELWLADQRIGESHSFVTEERGFRGRCLPKDLSALIAAMKPFGGAPLLEAVQKYNAELCRSADQRRSDRLVAD